MSSQWMAACAGCPDEVKDKYPMTRYSPRMKVPAKITGYCPSCNSHTEQSVSLYKKGKERGLAIGARRHERELKGYGGQKYPIQRNKAKTTDKKTLVLVCSKCGRKTMRSGIRLRKLELVR